MYAGTSGMKLENFIKLWRTIMNKSIMMGRVVNEPDLRYTQTENGELAIANFRLAVTGNLYEEEIRKQISSAVRLLAEKQSSRKISV